MLKQVLILNSDYCDKIDKNELIIFETEHILIPPTNFSDEMKCYQSFYSRQIVTCTACTLSTTRHSPYKFLHTQVLRMCYDVPQVIPAGWFRIRNMNLLLTTTRLARIEVPTKLWRKVMTQIHLGTKSNNTRMPIQYCVQNLVHRLNTIALYIILHYITATVCIGWILARMQGSVFL